MQVALYFDADFGILIVVRDDISAEILLCGREYCMQHEVLSKQRLLNGNGEVAEPGWARHPVWMYDRRDIAVPSLRIKEWDYYLAMNDSMAAAFTISDLGYAGMVSVSVIDLRGDSAVFASERGSSLKPSEHTQTVLTPFPLGRMGLRAVSSSGGVDFKNGRVHLRYDAEPGRRRIRCVFKDFMDGKDLRADLKLLCPDMESMCIATPWKKDPKAFYYNQKINCMPVSGKVELGCSSFRFHPKRDMAMLDWGRGVWTYDNIWYWGTCSTYIDGVPFGFNLGYGFSDRSSASENLIFYDHKVHKIENIAFQIMTDDDGHRDFMQPWTVTSSDGRFEAVFMPILDRSARIDLRLMCSDQHQIFGRMTGTVILDDGREIKMRDETAAVEVVHNKY